MAGSSGGEDEAISLNVTPLIDIIFCLCIFFMCSFHFKQLQGKLDSWLPKDHGCNPGPAESVTYDEARIFLRSTGATTADLSFGARSVGTLSGAPEDRAALDELEKLVVAHDADSHGKAPVIIDGASAVPWKYVVAVLDRCRKNNITRVEFAQPLASAR